MVIIETPIFTKRLSGILTDEEYRLLQMHLLNKPDAGKVIEGCGGVRIIYYWFVAQDTILLLFPFAKNERTDLTSEQLQQLRKIIEGEYP
jgi:hypothetical protein